ncbi:MAG: TerD family protein, partial [Frankia sp.]|nr:TerD family protein [Frankia sp.]
MASQPMTVTLPRGGNLSLSAAHVARARVSLSWRLDQASFPVAAGAAVDGVVVLAHRVPAAPAPNGEPAGPRVLLSHQVPNPAERPLHALAQAAGGRQAAGVEQEELVVDLAAVPPAVDRIQLAATIIDPTGRRPTFQAVRDAVIRVADDATGREVARFPVQPETGRETMMVFGELYRHRGEWKFRAVGQGYGDGLAGFLSSGDAEPGSPIDVAGFLTRTSPTRSRRTVTTLSLIPLS